MDYFYAIWQDIRQIYISPDQLIALVYWHFCFIFIFLGLSCLLIVLFIDDPKIHTTRLHRILRNLCYHAPTRDWVVKSLLSILEKSNDKQSQTEISDVQPPAKIRKSTSKSNTFSSDLAMAKGKICNIFFNPLYS